MSQEFIVLFSAEKLLVSYFCRFFISLQSLCSSGRGRFMIKNKGWGGLVDQREPQPSDWDTKPVCEEIRRVFGVRGVLQLNGPGAGTANLHTSFTFNYPWLPRIRPGPAPGSRQRPETLSIIQPSNRTSYILSSSVWLSQAHYYIRLMYVGKM